MRTRCGIALACCLFLLATPAMALAQAQSTTHIGDITLTGSQVYEVRGGTLRQKGNIYIGDNATLRLVDADLEFLKTDVENKQFNFTILGHGRLIVQNSRINLTNVYEVDTSGEAEVILDGSEAIIYEPYGTSYLIVGGFTLFGDASIQATDSKIGMIDLRDRSSAIATNTFIGKIYDDEKNTVKLTDCTVEDLLLWLRESMGLVKLELEGHVNHWNAKTDAAGIPREVELTNTTLIKGVTLYIWNQSIRLVNSHILNVAIEEGDLTIENSTITGVYLHSGIELGITNSNIDTVQVYHSDLLRLRVEGSRIGSFNEQIQRTNNTEIIGCDIGDAKLGYYNADGSKGFMWLRDTKFGNLTIEYDSPFEVHMDNVTIVESIGTPNMWFISVLEVSGNIIFGPRCTYQKDSNSIDSRLTRLYDIRVMRGSEPVQGANIYVHSGNSTSRSIDTDADGYAQFSLQYKDRFELVKSPNPGGPYIIKEFNMTTPVTMTVSHGGDVYETKVGLLTTTPIEVAFPTYTRPQREAFAVFFSATINLLAAYVIFSPRFARRS